MALYSQTTHTHTHTQHTQHTRHIETQGVIHIGKENTSTTAHHNNYGACSPGPDQRPNRRTRRARIEKGVEEGLDYRRGSARHVLGAGEVEMQLVHDGLGGDTR